MAKKQDFLLEIGTEELPPLALQNLRDAFVCGIKSGLEKAELTFDKIEGFITPRRLAVIVKNLIDSQPERLIERRGPAIDAAFKNGEPTPAALGFARSCGIAIDQIERHKNDKGEWLFYSRKKPGEKTSVLLPDIAREALKRLPVKKPMRWNEHTVLFVRPVHWVVMLFGKDTIDAKILEQKAGNRSFGHRFLCPKALQIDQPKSYLALLRKGYVIADFNERRESIREQVQKISGNKAEIDEVLLTEVAGLVEWPVALQGKFDEQFLEVPKEVLMTAMKIHQKYFPVVDKGRLLAKFIMVSNIDSKDPKRVIAGNERVICARLADAQFFYHQDLKHSLASRLDRLKDVVFQKKLGSLYDKAKRISQLSKILADLLGANLTIASRAAELAKADLMTEMIGEFPELQGIMGYYYALADKEDKKVAVVIKEHYLPRFAGDALPSNLESAAVAIADKLDTLMGIFGINQAPTGERDPFALRRAALGVLRICIEKQLPLDLKICLEYARELYAVSLPNDNSLDDTLNFMLDRLRAYYLDQKISADVFAAVMANKPTKPYDFDSRVKAVMHFKTLKEAESLTAANKRVNNILKQAGDGVSHQKINPSLLKEDAEKVLAAALEKKIKMVEPLLAAHNYTQSLTILADLKTPIDNFFDHVMVMADDEALRVNRLTLLHRLRTLFLQVADISLIQVKA